MDNEYLVNIIGLISLIVIITLSIFLILKLKRTGELQSEVDKLKKTLDETDEQAKLIVRTDMELNKTQEELAKKITGLYTLQKLSRAISTSLEENQIFNRIEPAYIRALGFEKSLAFLWEEKEKKFQCYLDIGYPENSIEEVKAYLNFNPDVYLNLIAAEKTLSSISPAQYVVVKDIINFKFNVTGFLLSPILPKEGNKGFIFMGTENTQAPVTEGDEELITILANELGQALENARLFEKTWRAQQELEKKVEERTRELTQALEEVRKISKRKTDFVSSVSHELRTPLTSIKGYASILLSGQMGQLPEDVRVRLDKINRHSDELVQFVNELLDITRIESGKVTMKQLSEDLKKIADEVADLLSEQLKEKEIRLSIDIPENAKVAFVDYGQVKRVFINLVSNAIKFTPQKGKISISTHKLDQEIQVDVNDTGCGIPDEAKEAIFEEFYRIDNPINQQVKGTGLGLSLVKNIVEAHKGNIWVASKAGQGTTFSFTLPK